MSEITHKGRTQSFWKLLQNHNVEIPIIQRDYAQGRKGKEEVRDNFITALFNSISSDQSIRLDFIYGSVINNAFQPLDGQQRLTTLFLLYWYAANKESISTESYADTLNKFKYETRISSREFCEALVSHKIEISNDTLSLKDELVDSAWFFLSWKKDPTIDSMLRMIDAIHDKFFNVENLWEKLTSESCLVDFYHVDLEDIGLTDDLYIKMNARGKLLSSFENFKASFEKYISDKKWEKTGDLLSSFAYKIDTVWTDLLWKHRKYDGIDEGFIRLISTVAMIRASIEKPSDRVSTIKSLQDKPDSLRSEQFSQEGFEYLCSVFDIYHLKSQSLKDLDFPLFQHASESSIFSSVVYEGANGSYTQKVLFYAQCEYLRKADSIDDVLYSDWMRVVRNIVSRGDVTKNGIRPAIIRSPETFDGVITLLNELSKGCDDIYQFLSSTPNLKSTFASEQLDEEKLKAKLINGNEKAKAIIMKLEDTNLFQGRIEFALNCIDFKDILDDEAINKLSKIHSIIKQYFDRDEHVNNDLRRALLTISDQNGNYEFYGYWWSFWYVVSANKRCLIDKYRELEFYIYGNYKNRDDYRFYIKKLILQLFNSSLEDIAVNFDPPTNMPNWKIRLIKDKSLLDIKSKSNYIAIPDSDDCCYLLKSMRPRDLEGCEKID
jgi:hypothetical protein